MSTKSRYTAKDIALLSVFLAAALIVGLVERMIPFDFVVPGVKLGLSNVVILTAIYIFYFPQSFVLVILKCVALMLITGNVSSFLYSISGSVLSFLVMWLLIRLSGSGWHISPVGISAVGGVFHNIGQILMASYILGSINVIAYLPVLVISGVITGMLVGTAVKYAMPTVKRMVHNQK